MDITPIHLETLVPPKDDLEAKIRSSALTLEEHDVIALSTKVVSISQGRCVLRGAVDKDELIKAESEYYVDRSETPGGFVMHTRTNGMLMANAGIDPFAGYYVLWPEDVAGTAERLLAWFKQAYSRDHLYLILTDSRSMPLRRGVIGTAVAWAGFEPLYDNRIQADLLGFPGGGSQTNVADALAAAAVFVMGEANEGTPLVRMRHVPYVQLPSVRRVAAHNSYVIPMEEDIFAPFLTKADWKESPGQPPR